MKVAVTGAGGFIGRHVVAELQRRGLDPIVVLRPPSTARPDVAEQRIVRLDIGARTPGAYEAMGRPDVLVHLAWGGLPNYQSLHHFECELPAQYEFLRGLVVDGLPALLVTGTCFEYGMQSGPLDEAMDARPTNPYGFAKDALRRQLEFLRRTKPFALTWARLFYLYGAGQAGNSLYAQFQQAIQCREVQFDMSGGEQLRDYLAIADVARYLVSLAAGGADSGIVNICSGQPTSVRKLVERWIAQSGASIRMNLGHYPYPNHEPMAFWGNTQKLERCLAACADTDRIAAR